MRPARPYVENSIDSRQSSSKSLYERLFKGVAVRLHSRALETALQHIEILLFSGQVRANDSIATTKIVAKNHPKLRNAGHIG
jgi:hypothetical protein